MNLVTSVLNASGMKEDIKQFRENNHPFQYMVVKIFVATVNLLLLLNVIDVNNDESIKCMTGTYLPGSKAKFFELVIHMGMEAGRVCC